MLNTPFPRRFQDRATREKKKSSNFTALHLDSQNVNHADALTLSSFVCVPGLMSTIKE